MMNTLATISHVELKTANRLIVLVAPDSDPSASIWRIRDLAITSGAEVLFLGLSRDSQNEFRMRRELITLCALFQNANVCTEAKVAAGSSWVDLVKSNCHAGDMIVCFADQADGLLKRSFHQILEAIPGTPVYMLSGVSQPKDERSDWLAPIIAWAGLIGIIAGSFLLQIQIKPVTGGWVQTTLLILSVLVELWLIWVWNSLFG